MAAAALVISQQDSVYRASMGVIVAQGGGDSRPEIGNRPLTQTMTNILESNVIASQVVKDLGLPLTSDQLLKKLAVSVRPDSSVLEITYDSTDREQAVAVLSSLGTAFLDLTREKLGVTDSLSRPGPLLIIANIYDPPHLQPEPVAPQPAKTLGFAGVLGLALGLILAFARESLDDRVRNQRDAAEWFGAPVIGTLPRGARGHPPAFVAKQSRGRDKRIEALRILRASFQFASTDVSGPTVVVTSAVEDEGKTTVVASLSMALAMAGKSVIAVESDLRRPDLHRLLGAPKFTSGLVDLIEDRVTLDRILWEVPLFRSGDNGSGADGNPTNDSTSEPREVGAGRLLLLPAGASTLDPTAVLTAERIVRLVNNLRERASYVIFDSAALLAAGETFPLAVGVDSVVIVAREGHTTRARAQRVRTMLEGIGARKVSVVLMDAHEPVRTAAE